MKNTFKNLMVLSSLMMLASCGGNNSTSSTNGSVITNTGTVSASNTPTDVQSLYNKLASALPCKSGSRLSTIAQFSLSGTSSSYNYSQKKIAGSFSTGTIGGSVSQLYMGVSIFNDLMIIAEMTNGSSVVGHNVYLSMCTQSSLIIEGRTLSGFQAPNGIVLDKNTSCPYGVVDAAINTYLQADAYSSSYGQIYPAAVWTTFYEITCN